jgi:hypothetical protein
MLLMGSHSREIAGNAASPNMWNKMVPLEKFNPQNACIPPTQGP